jgi:uncharacterized membrane protein
MKFDFKRFKNYGLWVAIASFGFIIAQDFGLQITPEKWNTYVDFILYIFVTLGIISDPKSGKFFSDNE